MMKNTFAVILVATSIISSFLSSIIRHKYHLETDLNMLFLRLNDNIFFIGGLILWYMPPKSRKKK